MMPLPRVLHASHHVRWYYSAPKAVRERRTVAEILTTANPAMVPAVPANQAKYSTCEAESAWQSACSRTKN
jgi:hypothetical protein